MEKLRNTFAKKMISMGKKDPNLVVLVGDISHGILKPMLEECPGRYYNIGICEPTIVNMAAGLSKVGLNPVVHTIAPFIVDRSYEQIKLDFGYQSQNVNIITVGGAFDYSQLGCSHHCYNDVSLLGKIPNAKVFTPGSPLEFEQLFEKAYSTPGIKYYRLTEYPHLRNFESDTITPGKAILAEEGKDITLVTFGARLKSALEASSMLAKRKVNAEVLYYHTITPFDEEAIIKSVNKTGKVLFIEESGPYGGLKERCLSALTQQNVNFSWHQIAITEFIRNYGEYEDLLAETELDANGIINRIYKHLI